MSSGFIFLPAGLLAVAAMCCTQQTSLAELADRTARSTALFPQEGSSFVSHTLGMPSLSLQQSKPCRCLDSWHCCLQFASLSRAAMSLCQKGGFCAYPHPPMRAFPQRGFLKAGAGAGRESCSGLRVAEDAKLGQQSLLHIIKCNPLIDGRR